MHNTSNWTGRAPRTLEEAFGPYCRSSSGFKLETYVMSFWNMIAYVCTIVVILLVVHFVSAFMIGAF